jgi:acyl-homoserine-lactone acylase
LGQRLIDRLNARAHEADEPVYDYLVDHLTDAERLDALHDAVMQLARDFRGWRIAWGDINRYQRLTDDVEQPFDDAKPSLPVGFAPAKWGTLASFDSATPRSTKRIYGSIGNSFVAAVEFGPTVRAKAILSGGQTAIRPRPISATKH